MKLPYLDSYSCQVYDHVVLTSLALAHAPSGGVDGTAVRDNLRAISQDSEGKRTDDAVEALKLVASGDPHQLRRSQRVPGVRRQW